jgi:hypothetical protein
MHSPIAWETLEEILTGALSPGRQAVTQGNHPNLHADLGVLLGAAFLATGLLAVDFFAAVGALEDAGRLEGARGLVVDLEVGLEVDLEVDVEVGLELVFEVGLGADLDTD